MEVNVIISLDAETKGIARNFLHILERRTARTEGSVPVHEDVMPEEISDVKMAESPSEGGQTIEEVAESLTADYASLRKEIKQIGVKLVQAKKQKDVKELTRKYGYSKIDELPDEKLESYLAELKEI